MVDNSGCNEDSDIEEALGSKKDSDTEYKSAPEDTENTDVPHQSNIPLIYFDNSSVTEPLPETTGLRGVL